MHMTLRWLRWFGRASWLHFWLLLLPCAYYCGIRHSVDLDDLFIYFRIVRSFLTTGRPELNPGDGSLMATSRPRGLRWPPGTSATRHHPGSRT